MKLVIHFTIIAVLGLLLFSCAVPKTEEQIQMEELADEILNSGKPVYMAHNLWYENPLIIEAINFKTLPNRIDAGAAVEDLYLTYYNKVPRVCFKIKGEIQTFCLVINSRYQECNIKKLTYKELIARTFTTIPFDELTSDLKQQEIDNIIRGTIQRGMSKKAVLMSWGYPPLHRTSSLDERRWTFWKMRIAKEYVDFDKDDRLLNSTWYGYNGNANDVIE